jgi:hypothetical protein
MSLQRRGTHRIWSSAACAKGICSLRWMPMTSNEFHAHLQAHAESFAKAVATDEGEWIIKGFIDVYKHKLP